MAYPVGKLVLVAELRSQETPDITWNDYEVWVDGKCVATAMYTPLPAAADRYEVWIVKSTSRSMASHCKQAAIEATVRELLGRVRKNYDFPDAVDFDHPSEKLDLFTKHFPEIAACHRTK